MRWCAGWALAGAWRRRWGKRILVCMGWLAEWGIMNSSMGSDPMEVKQLQFLLLFVDYAVHLFTSWARCILL